MQSIYKAFKNITNEEVRAEEEIKNSGSNRRYTRLRGKTQSLIAVVGESVEENIAFIELTRHFEKQQLPVPKLLYVSDDKTAYLQQDLGDTSLFNYIKNGRESGNFNAEEIKMLEKTIAKLPEFQFNGAENLDFSLCYPQAEFDRRTVLWDLNYFKYCFLKPMNVPFSESRLEDDFEAMATVLLQNKSNTFLYRDFQSRNVMIHNGEPYFIDYQGGRRGAIYYDVASFLWQAKANFPDDLREHLLNVYFEAARHCGQTKGDSDFRQNDNSFSDFRENLRHFVLFRHLQVLGAYGFRGLFERKAHFLESIPFAVRNLQELLKTDFVQYPYLCEILRKTKAKGVAGHTSTALSNHTSTTLSNQARNDGGALTVTIYSFSYKKGIPQDESGNGGGYVFDCRAVHNPGKYEEYKKLTGLDKPVIDFLEKDDEITRFLGNVYALADSHIERYIERGFSNLMFAFGCTGGQHRSVYSAQHLAEHIKKKYDIKVKLIHREQNLIIE
ncbi:MAG: phosphotransferase [Prevotellaceae bacterium]|nr:phosphotransferase [Prevotellaceae bacterium]